MLDCRCWCCEASFKSEKDARLCRRCQRLDDAVYANDPTPMPDLPPAAWTKAAMRERLGVTGDVDE